MTLDLTEELRQQIRNYLIEHPINSNFENLIRLAFSTNFGDPNKLESFNSILNNANQDQLSKILSYLRFEKELKKKRTELLLKRSLKK